MYSDYRICASTRADCCWSSCCWDSGDYFKHCCRRYCISTYGKTAGRYPTKGHQTNGQKSDEKDCCYQGENGSCFICIGPPRSSARTDGGDTGAEEGFETEGIECACGLI